MPWLIDRLKRSDSETGKAAALRLDNDVVDFGGHRGFTHSLLFAALLAGWPLSSCSGAEHLGSGDLPYSRICFWRHGGSISVFAVQVGSCQSTVILPFLRIHRFAEGTAYPRPAFPAPSTQPQFASRMSPPE